MSNAGRSGIDVVNEAIGYGLFGDLPGFPANVWIYLVLKVRDRRTGRVFCTWARLQDGMQTTRKRSALRTAMRQAARKGWLREIEPATDRLPPVYEVTLPARGRKSDHVGNATTLGSGARGRIPNPGWSEIRPTTRIGNPVGFGSSIEDRVGGRKTDAHSWLRVQRGDLVDDRALEGLFQLAVRNSVLTDCYPDRLAWFAAAEHAQRKARTNPEGLFAKMVRVWPAWNARITTTAEIRAHDRLRRLRDDGVIAMVG